MSGETVQPSVEIPLGMIWVATKPGEDDREYLTEAAALATCGPTWTIEQRPRMVVVDQPTDGQMVVLTRVSRLSESGKVGDAIFSFGDVLDAMMPNEDDKRFVRRALAEGTLSPREFFQVAVDVLEHFSDGNTGAPGAPPRKRARPAASRRPAR